MKCFFWFFINSFIICIKCGGWLGEYIKIVFLLYMYLCILIWGVIYILVIVGNLLIIRFFWRFGKLVRVIEIFFVILFFWYKKFLEKVLFEVIICLYNYFWWKFVMLRGKFLKYFYFLFFKNVCLVLNCMYYWCFLGLKFCICFIICNKKCIFGGNVVLGEFIWNDCKWVFIRLCKFIIVFNEM